MAGALLAFLALAPWSTGAARAGCLKPHESSSHFEHLVRAGALPEASGHDAATSPPGKPPTCSGPLCSRGPAAPPAASWTASSVHEPWACLADRLRPAADPGSPLPFDAAPALPGDRALSIFHPPRRPAA